MPCCLDENATNVAFQALISVTCFAGCFPFLVPCDFVAHLLVKVRLLMCVQLLELAALVCIERLNTNGIHVIEDRAKT